MSQNLTIALNAILSDTVSNSRRNIFSGSFGWQATSGINFMQNQFSTTSQTIGSCGVGIVLASDYPLDITFVSNGTSTTFLAQTLFVMSGSLQSITIKLSAGYTATSTTNIALVS